MERKIKGFLEEKHTLDLLRSLKTVEHLVGGKLRVNDREYVNLSSNDYLGLASHPGIARAASLSTFVGAGSSRLMTGTTQAHARLEQKVAEFKNKPAAIVFNSGYQANVGIISALLEKNDCVLSDRLNHASIVDGISLSKARHFRFRHNDAGHLEELLKKKRSKYEHALIVTETVFSMNGDIAPIEEIVRLKKKYDCTLMVDEAHATGVFGKKGSGLTELKNVASNVDIIMGTFSKALGSFGAYAAVSEEVREYLINTCRSFIYSTALPTSIVEANIAAIDIVEKESFRREHLLLNADYMRNRLKHEGFLVKGESQIIPVIVHENEKAVKFSEALKKKGFWVIPVRPPTVPKGEARLRISLTYDHTREVIDQFVSDLAGLENRYE